MKRILAVCLALALSLCAFTVPACAEVPYNVTVDVVNQIVTVYSNEDGSIVRQMICSTGTQNYATKKGTYTLQPNVKKMERQEWYAFEEGWARYATRIVSQTLFHSYLFEKNDVNTIDWDAVSQLGVRASHGCVRMYVADAYWITRNLAAGTKVKITYGCDSDFYLRKLLIMKSFSVDDGVSYADFTGITDEEGCLGYGSTGEKVKDLQKLLIERGLYSGEIDGLYDEDMVRLVKIVQGAAGMKQNGICDGEFLDLLDSDDCPQSVMGSFESGSEGAGVMALQADLLSMGLYKGGLTGVYDTATEDAVKQYQTIAGVKADGIATPSVQSGISQALDTLESKYGRGNFAIFTTEKTVSVATVTSDSKLNLRSRANTTSTIYDRIAPNEKCYVVEKGETWSKVTHNGITGWLMNKYLTFATETEYTYNYGTADDAYPAIPRVESDNGGLLRVQTVTYAVSKSKNNLIARFTPAEKGTQEFKIPTGARFRVLEEDGKWTRVEYGGKQGYVLSKYLKYETVTELAEPEKPNDPGVTSYARIKRFSNPFVYAKADPNSDMLTELIPGTRIGIMEKGADYMRVNYRGVVGYIPVKRVTLDEEEIVNDPVPYEEDQWEQLWEDDAGDDGEDRMEDGDDGEETEPADIAQDEDRDTTGYPFDLVPPEDEAGNVPADDGDDAQDAADGPVDDTVYVYVDTGTDAELNLHSAPTADGKILTTLANSTRLTVLMDMGDWLYVEIEDLTGYVMSRYCR